MQAELHLRIHGMDCVEEIAVLKRERGPLVGDEQCLAFDILNGTLTVQPGDGETSAEVFIQAVARTGTRAEVWMDETLDWGDAHFWTRRGRSVAMAASGL